MKPAIQSHVKSFVPKTVNQAYSLAVLQESSLKHLHQELNSGSRRTPQLPTPVLNKLAGTWKSNSKPVSEAKGKNIIDFDDRRARGLCFWCDDNYVRGHVCKKKELFVIEVTQIQEDSDQSSEDGEKSLEDVVEDDSIPLISEIAIHGVASKGYHTMRVTVYVNKKPSNILIDSGSTHNFLDVHIARKLSCKIEVMGLMKVDVANGASINCNSICKGLV